MREEVWVLRSLLLGCRPSNVPNPTLFLYPRVEAVLSASGSKRVCSRYRYNDDQNDTPNWSTTRILNCIQCTGTKMSDRNLSTPLKSVIVADFDQVEPWSKRVLVEVPETASTLELFIVDLIEMRQKMPSLRISIVPSISAYAANFSHQVLRLHFIRIAIKKLMNVDWLSLEFRDDWSSRFNPQSTCNFFSAWFGMKLNKASICESESSKSGKI